MGVENQTTVMREGVVVYQKRSILVALLWADFLPVKYEGRKPGEKRTDYE